MVRRAFRTKYYYQRVGKGSGDGFYSDVPKKVQGYADVMDALQYGAFELDKGLDLSTAEGQAAYQAFISGGTIPDWAPPGVQQSGTTEVFSHEFARSIGAELGPLSVGFSSESVWSRGSR